MPVDQNQQTCKSSFIEDEMLETQKHLEPSYPSILEDLMSMDDEENLPLQKVLEKCGKQKKHAEKKFTSKAPLPQETQRHNDVQLEAPMTAVVEGNCEQEIKVDAVASLYQQQELLSKPAADSILKQKNKPLKKDGQGRPRKAMKKLSNAATGQKSSRGRPRKQKETITEDAMADPRLELLQVELYKPAINDQQTQVQIKKTKKDRGGKPLKLIEATKEGKQASLDLYLQSQEGLSELVNQCSAQLPENDGRGSRRKLIEATKDDAEAFIDMHLQIQEGPFKSSTDRRTPRKQAEATTEYAAGCSNLHTYQQEESSEPSTNLHSQEQSKRVKKGRGRPRKQTEVADSTASSKLAPHQHPLLQFKNHKNKLLKKDGQGSPRKVQEECKKDSEGSANLHLQNYKQEVNKDDSEAPLYLPHMAEETECKVDCPDAEHEKSQNEVQRIPETGQVMPPLCDYIYQCAEKQKLDGGGQLPEETKLTNSSDNQPDQQREVKPYSQEQEVKKGEFEDQARPTSKSTKSTEMQVPLSSKDQLRSRIKRQAQDST